MSSDTITVGVLAFAVGALTSHATLGRQIERCLAQLADIARRLDVLEKPRG